MRMRNKPWAEDYMLEHRDIVSIDLSQKDNITSWFEKVQPIHIEVGSGMGRFITEMAKSNPAINYIGIERDKNVMIRIVEKAIEQDIKNLRLLTVDAEKLTEIFNPGEIDRVYLNFSDPWPKTRHAKRRLTHANFLSVYKTILKDEGEIHFKTDNQGLFEFSIESMSQFGMKLKNINLNLHDNEPADNIKTEYEEKFSAKGFRINRLEASFK
ncbi:tRNA (guanosine(46)-N7)-methyltransferase TrmB [Macrococcoides bohemicum]|jgi:tRNA (guanine-N7-)-methyltransferase|uniref:tRNA (guanine-N(7)-)-methyltransferase n=1 Tax=Macrococcoides bohemicum TaxID=1903056 RepID=A0A4R5Y8D7_9STAP|nr:MULTISPECIES: tRNA (guanosine(46)-N7)-methyltransferase TrmB [Macrococcus]ATD29964.1 tRNA (guanosine(46)-N7)-methyltransferase TrmB [Macrococcus sp. IME1552]QRN50339.1 tRNA (guanosine(46)-N7)-methyltransferase TrmB [Macrococcus bohemicus]QYA41755.1 tRNA (guanosine(46)-N7)-methyltransferase TrmB [Macrococcus bohemicus]QYA44184.1 tRNA (guanosine(46)-N7)-methyltransferase TrmB [Macrococcus bohemicus]TDL40873.1 tRNA (guanosine(46)-N7)-methyltransferase TrmB [Macrococcus bohemicus]